MVIFLDENLMRIKQYSHTYTQTLHEGKDQYVKY